MMDTCVNKAENLSKRFQVRKRHEETLIKRFFSRKQYQEVRALDRVSLKIRQGELVGLIGHNGAGKSTLVKLMTGILYPSDGVVRVLGRNPFTERVKNNQEIGVVFGQRTQLNWDLSTMDSLDLLKRIYCIDDLSFKANIEMFCEIFNMREILSRPVRTLSLGERMQCEMLAAFIHNPKVVFLDEPTIGLDVINKDAIVHFLKAIKERGDTTVILTTHDLEEMCKICDQIIVLQAGQILIKEKTETLLKIHNEMKRIVFTTKEAEVSPIFWEQSIEAIYEPHKIDCENVKCEDMQYVIFEALRQATITDVQIEERNFTDIIKEYLKVT